MPHNPAIKIADGSGTEVVSAACSAAKRLEPDTTKQPTVIRILDALFFIGTITIKQSALSNKTILTGFGWPRTGLLTSFCNERNSIEKINDQNKKRLPGIN